VRPAAAFEKKYGIKIDYVRANTADISLRCQGQPKIELLRPVGGDSPGLFMPSGVT
jgi:hypothetical protein